MSVATAGVCSFVSSNHQIIYIGDYLFDVINQIEKGRNSQDFVNANLPSFAAFFLQKMIKISVFPTNFQDVWNQNIITKGGEDIILICVKSNLKNPAKLESCVIRLSVLEPYWN